MGPLCRIELGLFSGNYWFIGGATDQHCKVFLEQRDLTSSNSLFPNGDLTKLPLLQFFTLLISLILLT